MDNKNLYLGMDRKKTVLLHIQKYCMEIEENLKFFGTQVDTFKMNNIFRDLSINENVSNR